MPGDGERYDIVVVGVQVDDDTASHLAADLSALTGLSPHKVSLAVHDGELIVHRSLTGIEARRAANSLRRLGAAVEIRTSLDGDEPIPDIDVALGEHGLVLPHARGGKAPIAPPPEFGGASVGRNIDIGAKGNAAQELLDPSRPQGRPEDLVSERPFVPERATSRGRPTPHPGAAPRLPVDPDEDDARKPRDAYVGTPRRKPNAEVRGVAGQIADAQRLAESLEAAAESDDAIEVVTLDGVSSESVEVKLGGPPPGESGSGAATSSSASASGSASGSGHASASGPSSSAPAAASLAASSSAQRRAPAGDRLALDFDAPRDPPPRAPVSAASPRVEAPLTVRNTGPRAPVPASLRPEGQAIFSADPLANYLFGIAVGLAIGMAIAFMAVRMSVRADVLALEQELAEAVTQPLQVEIGQLRDPEEIALELDAKYGRSRLYFVLTMLLVGVPTGLGLGRIRR
jgi:hypothetical protein